MKKIFKVDENYISSRLDRWFKRIVCNVPQSLIEKNIRKGNIKVNFKKVKSSYKLQNSDEIIIKNFNFIHKKTHYIKKAYLPTQSDIKSASKFFIENNENFVVINKPSGIAVQSGTKSKKNILDILSKSNEFENCTPFPVHRIDKETTGLLIVAKNRKYAQLFTSLFRIRKIHKTYLAITYGTVKQDINLLQDNLTTYEKNKKVIQKAISHLKILKSNDEYSFLELKPITGRKHQLRKQLYNIGHPIVGDDKYSFSGAGKKLKVKNIMLHAYKIKFMINNIKYNFEAKYGEEFEQLIKRKF